MQTKTFLAVLTAATLSFNFATAADSLPNDDWLHVEGNQIVDQQGNPVWLTGANWFGFNTTERVLHGLWSVNLEDTLAAIAARGINILRVPISTELIYEWQTGQAGPAQINTAANPNLVGASTLEVFDAMIDASRDLGLKILLDVHSAEADNMGHIEPLWYNSELTPEIFYSTWEWITERYRYDDTLIAVDLENEPHGQPWNGGAFAKWDDSTDDNNWKHACESAAERILDINPNMLIMCEGIESYPTDGTTWTSTDKDDYHSNWWGGNLRAVRDYPIDLGDRQQQFMYSPHDYGPLVFEQPWFYEGFTKDTLYEDVWKDNWMFIHEENISPLLIGEWGGFMDGGPNETWMLAIRDLIIEHGLHHTFWCINPNSGDTGGLLDHSWTQWDEEKYALLEPSLWKNDEGKYIGLDHQVALGSTATGVSLNEHFGNQSPSVSISAPLENATVSVGSDVVIEYQLSRASGVNVYVNNTLVTTGPLSGSVIISAPQNEGSFDVLLQAIDANGAELSVSDSVRLNAVQEPLPLPAIAITEPIAGSTLTGGQSFTVVVNLQEAAGFQYTLGTVDGITTGTTAELIAPQAAGNYTLTVTAVDDGNQSLGVSDSIQFTVAPTPVADVRCDIAGEDVWTTGFVLNNIEISNHGDTPISGWQLHIPLANTMGFANGWGGDFTELNNEIRVTNLAYNGSLAPGQSTRIGLQGTLTGTFERPTCRVVD